MYHGEQGESRAYIKALFDQIAADYDDVYLESFEAKVFGTVTWRHLMRFLPEDRSAVILDAGGGTGRWTIPLAKMGYRVSLCDISEGMLSRAEKKVHQEGLSDKVEIRVEDITCLSFKDESFDFVVCEDGPLPLASDVEKAAMELVRVLKRNGIVWTGAVGRYPLVWRVMKTDPENALEIAKGARNYVEYKGAKCRVFTPQELEELFSRNGVTAEKKYGYRIATQFFSPDYDEKDGRMIKSETCYDESYITKVAEIELLLSEIPSLLGVAEYIQIVGRKI